LRGRAAGRARGLEVLLGEHPQLAAGPHRHRPAGARLVRAGDVLHDGVPERRAGALRRPDDAHGLAFVEPRPDRESVTSTPVDDHLARALALAAAARGRAYPKPTVGAVLVRDGEVVGEGATEAGGRHGEAVALDAAGERARGATLYVTMEPCAHWGTTPPCAERIAAAGVARVVAGSRDPNPEAAGGLERLAAAGVEVELADSFEARAQNEAWRVWVSLGRPFVVYKAAVTLDGRMAAPGGRWVTGEESRRRVHELRAAADAVAVGMGTVRADNPRLDARGVDTPRGQPRRLAFGRGPL